MIILHEIAAASAVTPSAAAKKTLYISTVDGRPWLKDSSGVSTPLDGNTVLYGTAAPTTEGVDGNFYIRTTTSFIYGPKASGVWPAGASLVGANGASLLTGTVNPTTEGVNGDSYFNTVSKTYFGPKAAGVWPAGIPLGGFTSPTGTGLASITGSALDAAAKPIGVASATDILDRQSGDARYAASSHAHSAADITSGTVAQARLGTGSGGAGTKVLYDDQTYKTITAGPTTEFIVLKAAAFIPRTTTGAGINSTEAPTNKENFDVLEFDTGTDEHSQIDTVMPNDWNLGTVTAVVHWTAASGSGDVVFGVRAVSHANGDAIDIAFGTAQTVTDTLTAVNDYDITSSTGPITIAGTLAAGNNVTFELYRDADAGGDTLGVKAQVNKLVITYTKL